MKSPHERKKESGFTLVELALVIALLAIMSTLAASRFGLIDSWRQKTNLRKFLNTWELLSREARSRGESYRLVIDINRNTYTVRREVPVDSVQSHTTDHLKNFRTKSEQARLAKEEQEKLLSTEEEFKEEEAREGDALENIFYRMVFRDPDAGFRLGVPIEFPSMKNDVWLGEELHIRDVEVRGEKFDQGVAAIRFTSFGGNEFSVIHFDLGSGIMTGVMNPATGRVQLLEGDVKYEWTAALKE